MQGKGNTNSEIPYMSNHMETCLKCKNEYFYNSQFCPKCNSINIKISNWIPETLKLEYVDKCTKQSTPVTKKFLKNEFKKILKKYKKTPHSLVLKKIPNAPLVIISHDDYHERLKCSMDDASYTHNRFNHVSVIFLRIFLELISNFL